MAWITDSLRGAIEAASRFSPFQRGNLGAGLPGIFSHQMALAAYMSSGMLKKVITIPADDRVREWRDWQAEQDDIVKIEAEEKRLALQAKVQQAETLRGIGGGAIIIITTGNHADEIRPDQMRPGGIVALNVVSRWQIQPRDIERDLASPNYGLPAYFEVDSGKGKQTRIHPSRVICFRGAPLPAGSAVDDVETFWGDSRLLRVWNEVTRSDDTQAWFSALVRKAKLTRIGIPDLISMLASPEGKQQLNARIALIAEGESTLNATVYRSGTGTDDPGEKIDDYQITWAGIPAVMDAFDQRVAAVSDIPFTRLMGRSPAGMNATGEHDDKNWSKMVKTGQELEMRPCLEQLDPLLLRSAGVTAPDVWWEFAPLSVPSEKETADIFKGTMEAVEKVQATGAIPDEAFAKGFQNLLIERGWIPGLEGALAEIPEAERYGLNPEDDGTDPSALQAGKEGDPASAGEGGSIGSGSPRRAANDAKPIPLYVQRKLLNAADLIKWAKAQGFESTLPADDMHVTVLYSRTPVDPLKMGEGWGNDEDGNLIIRAGGPRAIERLGENAVVLSFASWSLASRHDAMVSNGASHDWPEYTPHVTISYGVPEGVDLDAIKSFIGELRFGPEEFSALDLDWKQKVTEQ